MKKKKKKEKTSKNYYEPPNNRLSRAIAHDHPRHRRFFSCPHIASARARTSVRINVSQAWMHAAPIIQSRYEDIIAGCSKSRSSSSTETAARGGGGGVGRFKCDIMSGVRLYESRKSTGPRERPLCSRAHKVLIPPPLPPPL